LIAKEAIILAGSVVAVFSDKAAAENASRALLDDGVSLNDISVVVKGEERTSPGDPDAEGSVLTSSVREVSHHDVEQPAEDKDPIIGAAAGAGVGVPFGLFLASAMILIPGLGPVIAAGPVLAMLTGGAIGGAAGALVGALASEGIPQAAAHTYHDSVEAGQALVAVIASGDHDKIEKILTDKGGRDVGYYPRVLDTVQTIES
jgi:hypothetical protein